MQVTANMLVRSCVYIDIAIELLSRKLAEQDKQKLSISDGDSFVGHGFYHPSPYKSLHNKAGPVLTKLQFRESTGSDIANVADSSSFICLKKTDTPATFYNILR